MAGVPFIFGNATTSIPLSNLDADFNTPVTIGNTTVGLGNTVTTLGNVTLNNVTITSGSINASVTEAYANANAVVYSNTSNVGVTSTALTFDGTNLGIGTSSPQAKLNIVAFEALRVNDDAGFISFWNASNTTRSGYLQLQSAGVSSLVVNANQPLTFQTNGTERMRIANSGEVGIGASPIGAGLTVSAAGASIYLTDTTGTSNTWRLLAKTSSTNQFRIYDQTQGADRLVIDSSGNVGIGTSSAGTKLDVNGIMRSKTWSLSGSGVTGGTTDFSAGTVTTNSNWGYYFVAPTGSGAIADYAFFNPAGTERARIPNAGGFQCVNSISVGNATPSTSGAGVTFPSTQSASSDANTLDDYEEGTFTPTLIDGSNNQPTSYLAQVGTYTKVGNLVTVQIYLNINVKGATISGSVSIGGLPFTSSGTSNNYQAAYCGFWGTMATSQTWLSGFMNPSTVRIALYKAAASLSTTPMQASDWNNTGDIMYTCSYRI
jgi:hypothetical protein